jgi:peptide/nickel transport system substrate-binding protein
MTSSTRSGTRRGLTRRQVTTSALAAAAAATGGLGPMRTAQAGEKTLTVGSAVFPDSLRPGISSFQALNLMIQTNEPLIARDNVGNLHPALAVSWKPVADTTMRFSLRQGVKCHDGEEFTAEDVAFTISRIVDPQTAYGMLARIGAVTGATVVDKYTVDIHTKAVFPTLLKGLSDIVMETKHYYDKVGANGVQARPMGTGPWVYQKWTPGDRYELVAHKSYWGGAPKLDRLVLREIPDAGTRVASLVSGETQVIEEVPIDLIGQVNQSGAAKVDEVTSTVGLVLTYDVRSPPFDNPKVRLALDYAVDKQAILKEILKGHGELLQGQLLTAATFGHNPAIKARAYDPDKARALLKEAGYDTSTPVPITTQSGKYVSDVDIANAVAGMLNKVGVKATVTVTEGGVFLQKWRAFQMGPMYMVGWYSLGDADFATTWYTKGGLRSVWINEEFEKLFLAGRSTNDEAARLKAYHRMMEIMYEENPSMYLFGLPSLYGVSQKISGFGAAADKLLRVTQTDFK